VKIQSHLDPQRDLHRISWSIPPATCASDNRRTLASVNRIRVGMMNVRPRLRDIIVDAVRNESDVELMSIELQSERDLESAGVDVLIVGTAEPEDLELPVRMLYAAPRMSVLMIAASGCGAVLYELRPRKQSLGDVTAAGLIAAIRLSAGDRAAPRR
jgi:uncharacterized protein YgbK (DUF1537 family)